MSNNSVLEKPAVHLGFVALTDCLPLVVAQERGFFAEQGLDVELSCEPWGSGAAAMGLGHCLATGYERRRARTVM